MAGVAVTLTDLALAVLPTIFTFLETQQDAIPHMRLDRIFKLPLGERTPVMVFLESP